MLRPVSAVLFALVLVSAGTLTMTGCGPTDGGDGDGDAGVDPFAEAQADVEAKVATFDTAGFTKVSINPAPTQHSASSHSLVWVTTEHASLYRAIDPAAAEQTVDAFPEGFIAVKEQTNDVGAPTGQLLVMAKFPAGYNADAGDWWWASFTDKDTLSGTSGTVQFCITCHTQAEGTDFLGGVEVANQQ